jgi:uncharacterized coiled-coil protein SlyX
MTTNQPNSIETRLTRLETLFTNVGETVLSQNDAITAQSATIDVLVANIQQLTENAAAVDRRIDALTTNVTKAGIDRQEFRTEIRQIWEYLRERNGGSSTPQR